MRICGHCLGVVAVFALAGCAANPKELIVGKWESADGKAPIKAVEFLRDGSVKIPTAVKGVYAEGKYRIVADDKLEVEYTVPIVNMQKVDTFKMEITRESLTVTDERGNKYVYKRVQPT